MSIYAHNGAHDLPDALPAALTEAITTALINVIPEIQHTCAKGSSYVSWWSARHDLRVSVTRRLTLVRYRGEMTLHEATSLADHDALVERIMSAIQSHETVRLRLPTSSSSR